MMANRASKTNGKFPSICANAPLLVMPGLVPRIHVFLQSTKKGVDGRDIGERKRRRPSDGYARP
jgi:hypothetical protein